MYRHMFPCLDHNDILRLRRVCKRTEEYATGYLWSYNASKNGGHCPQGNCTIRIGPVAIAKTQTAQTALLSRRHPASNLALEFLNLSEYRAFFRDMDLLEQFIQMYSKYVTHLITSRLWMPLMNSKEIRFFESFVNLEKLTCGRLLTGGPKVFCVKRQTNGNCFIPTSFKRIKSITIDECDNVTCMWKIINGIGVKVETIQVPSFNNNNILRQVGPNFDFVKSFILDNPGLLKCYTWTKNCKVENFLEVLRLFKTFCENKVMVKNLDADILNCIFCDENGMVDRTLVVDYESRERVFRVEYGRNLFFGSIIFSLTGLNENVFFIPMPNLEEIRIESTKTGCSFRFWQGQRYCNWPKLKTIYVKINSKGQKRLLNFLFEKYERQKLENIELHYANQTVVDKKLGLFPIPNPTLMVNGCRNLKKLSLSNFYGDSSFFLTLWKELLLLEHITLSHCPKLGNRGFIGYDEADPVFLKLKSK